MEKFSNHFSSIVDCNCNVEGSTSSICDKDTGACDCKSDLITGTLCDHSVDGYFGFPTPEECHCNGEGSEATTCDDGSGKCSCKADVVGDKCDQCAVEHFGFPNCQGTILKNIFLIMEFQILYNFLYY